MAALEEAGALEGTGVLEAIEHELPDTGTKAREGADLLALKASKVSFMLSLDRVKFLESLMEPIGTTEAEKETSVQLELETRKKGT